METHVGSSFFLHGASPWGHRRATPRVSGSTRKGETDVHAFAPALSPAIWLFLPLSLVSSCFPSVLADVLRECVSPLSARIMGLGFTFVTLFVMVRFATFCSEKVSHVSAWGVAWFARSFQVVSWCAHSRTSPDTMLSVLPWFHERRALLPSCLAKVCDKVHVVRSSSPVLHC